MRFMRNFFALVAVAFMFALGATHAPALDFTTSRSQERTPVTARSAIGGLSIPVDISDVTRFMSSDPPLPTLESDASSVHAVYFGVTNGGGDQVGQLPPAPEGGSATLP